MDFAVSPPLVLAPRGQVDLLIGKEAKGPVVPKAGFLRNHLQARALDARRGIGEVLVDQSSVETHRLEDLGPAIGLNRGNSHLRHHLQNPLGQRLDEVTLRLVGIHTRQFALSNQLSQAFKCEIGIDRIGAVAEQQRQVVDFPGLSALHQQADAGSSAMPNQVMMKPSQREKGWNRRLPVIHPAVRQNQEGFAIGDGRISHRKQLLQFPLESRRSFGGGKQDRKRFRLKFGQRGEPDSRQFAVVEDRRLQLDLPTTLRLGREKISLRSDVDGNLGDQLFPNRVQRGVGDLREELREVVVEQPRVIREHGEGGVVAHRAHRLFALGGHRRQNQPQILERVPECQLAFLQSPELGSLRGKAALQFLERD